MLVAEVTGRQRPGNRNGQLLARFSDIDVDLLRDFIAESRDCIGAAEAASWAAWATGSPSASVPVTQ